MFTQNSRLAVSHLLYAGFPKKRIVIYKGIAIGLALYVCKIEIVDAGVDIEFWSDKLQRNQLKIETGYELILSILMDKIN